LNNYSLIIYTKINVIDIIALIDIIIVMIDIIRIIIYMLGGESGPRSSGLLFHLAHSGGLLDPSVEQTSTHAAKRQYIVYFT
jgi:hypothetical protein